jgi:hypothetical protein
LKVDDIGFKRFDSIVSSCFGGRTADDDIVNGLNWISITEGQGLSNEHGRKILAVLVFGPGANSPDSRSR